MAVSVADVKASNRRCVGLGAKTFWPWMLYNYFPCNLKNN